MWISNLIFSKVSLYIMANKQVKALSRRGMALAWEKLEKQIT